jgi:hypothetical protein
MQEISDNLGISIEKLVDNIEILGDVDIFGRTTKTLPEISEQFEKIDAAIQDIDDNGKISIDNL